MEPATRLAVVLVHRNQPEACERTAERFRSHGRPLRLVVVDNGSEPDRLAALHAWADPAADVEVIEAGANTGFGPGANIGLRAWLADPDGGQWALLAPHDADPRPGCLDALFDALDAEPLAGLACADVGDGMVPFIDPYFGGIIRPGGTEPGWEPADYPHGTLMALRRSCLDDIGLFEESFFAYCEEADLGLRARRAGWTVGLVRGARVQNTHLSSSVAVVDYLQQRNTLRFVRELSGRYHVAIRMLISLGHIRRGLMRPATAPPVFDPRARLFGMRDFLLGRSGPPPPEVVALEARHRKG